jgi:hypothetical protein
MKLVEKGVPVATAPPPTSPRRAKLLDNYDRVMRLTRGKRIDLDSLDDRQICIAIENEMFRVGTVGYRCNCGVTVFRLDGRTETWTLNYDGSVHTCRRKPAQVPDLYQKTLRGLGRGRA